MVVWSVEVAAEMTLAGEETPRLVWLPLGSVEVAPRTRREYAVQAGAEKFGLVPELGRPARLVRIVDPRYVAEGDVTSEPPEPQDPVTRVRLKDAG